MTAPPLYAAPPPWSATDAEVEAFLAAPRPEPVEDYTDPGPFAADVKAGKNSPLYNAHAYHTKVPPRGIVAYLEHYTRPGDVVLDPFCGSGMTGVACLLSGRRAVLNDLSPAATHIAAGYTRPVDLAAVRAAWTRVEDAVRDEIAWLYETRCERCSGPATIQYTVWSDTYGCGNCGAEIVLWDAAVVRELKHGRYEPPLSDRADLSGAWRPPEAGEARDADGKPKPAGSVLERFACPACLHPWAKTELDRRGTVPVLVDLECDAGCRPRRAARAPLPFDLERIDAIAARLLDRWVPEAPFDEDREMWRGGHRDGGITRARDFWTPRNLAALAAVWEAIGNGAAAGSRQSAIEDGGATRLPDPDSRLPGVQGALRFAFTASLMRASRQRRFLMGGSGVVSGTLYIPSLSLEVNAMKLLAKKVKDFCAARAELGAAQQRADVLVRTGSATDLHGVPDGAIDYVFTDPPFGSNIFYADCSFPWEAWLGSFTDERFEAVWNKSRKPDQGGKTLPDYAALMSASFREMQRVLKPGRWASVVFHNSDDRVWDAIRDAATAAGFELVNALAFDKEQRSFKGVKGEKGEERVTNFDIVLNLRKPGEAIGSRQSAIGDERAAIGSVQSAIGDGGAASSERLSPLGRTPPPTADSRLPIAAPALPVAGSTLPDVDEHVGGIVADHLAALAAGRSEAPVVSRTSAGEQRTTQFLHSLVIRRLLSDGLPVTDVDYARVEQVARGYFKLVDGRWYGRGEEVTSLQPVLPGMGQGIVVRDEASAIVWARERIRSGGPQPWDALIADLKMAAPSVRFGRSIDEILRENFVQDRRNRWRLPTPDELAELGDVSKRLLQHRVERWLTGTGPGPRDGAEKAAWFDHLFDYGQHTLAHAVFQRLYADEVDAATWDRIRRRSRVTALRAGQSAPKPRDRMEGV